MLSQSEIDRYHADGLIVPEARLPDDTVGAMRALLDDLVKDDPDLSTDFVPGLVEADARWLEFVRIPMILDIVSQLIGPDFLNWCSSLFGKPARDGLETPWHQDGEYWPIRPLATCSIWIALDASTPENGCMRFVPGSHRARESQPHKVAIGDGRTLERSIADEAWAEEHARDVVLEPGQFAIFDVFTVHGSRANRSDTRRAGVAFRYMPTTSHFDFDLAAAHTRELGRPANTFRQLHLMRGTDRCGRNDFQRNKPADTAGAPA